MAELNVIKLVVVYIIHLAPVLDKNDKRSESYWAPVSYCCNIKI